MGGTARRHRTELTVSRVVVIEYVSLDGVIQGPGHAGEDLAGGFKHGGWTGPFMAEHGRYLSEVFSGAGAFLLGRLTYDIWARYWPTVTDETDEIATALNGRPKYVASATLRDPAWADTTAIRDVPVEVAKLREQPGRPLVVMGSSGLVHTLTESGLVDEYQMWIHPVVLGGGKKLFPDGGPKVTLRLVDSMVTAGGLVIATYKPWRG